MQIATNLKGTMNRHPRRWVLAAVLLASLVGFAFYWFAPWNLFVDRRVDESLPSAAGAGVRVDNHSPGVVSPGSETEPVTLARGEFRSLEHGTSGTALILELADGKRFLRLEDLETSNGPDLRVILTDQPPSDDWHVWDDGELVDLGALVGNLGSSNYEIPKEVDLSGFKTAVIWCRRFSVGFGVAPVDSPSN